MNYVYFVSGFAGIAPFNVNITINNPITTIAAIHDLEKELSKKPEFCGNNCVIFNYQLLRTENTTETTGDE